MKKHSLDDDIFDAVLSQAFAEAFADEFADVPKPGTACTFVPKKKRPGRTLVLLIAAAALLTAGLLWLCLRPDGYSLETPEYVYGFIPEDYVVTKYRDKGCIGYSFENSIDKTYITINYSPSQWTSFSVDNEFSTITEHSINGNIVYWMTYSKTISNVETLFWNDNYNIFEIYGNVSEKVLFKIAEHITRKPQ